MGPSPDQRTAHDLRLVKAKKALSRVSGGKDRPRQMKTRARWAIILGAILIILGVFLGTFFKDLFFMNLLETFVFLGMVIIGFGLVVLLAFK
jgi:hypothetical protein